MDAALVKHDMSPSPLADVRDYRIHEVTQPAADAAAGLRRRWRTPSPTAPTRCASTARRRRRRRWPAAGSTSRTPTAAASSWSAPTRSTDFRVADADAPQMWPLSFDRAPAPFTRADFDEAAPTVTVFGNLVDASQGKAEREAVLGNGDDRQIVQTFPLPKSPLTYFLAAGGIPAADARARDLGRRPPVDARRRVLRPRPDETDLHRARGRRGPQLRAVRRRRDRRAAAVGAEERQSPSTAAASARAARSSPARRPPRASGRRASTR